MNNDISLVIYCCPLEACLADVPQQLLVLCAGPQRIPAINPNRAYLKSLAQGSAKKHFQSVEVDLREAHRRLIATSKDLQPVTFAAAAKTHVFS